MVPLRSGKPSIPSEVNILMVSQTAVRIRYLLLLSIDVTHRGGFCGDAWPKDLKLIF